VKEGEGGDGAASTDAPEATDDPPTDCIPVPTGDVAAPRPRAASVTHSPAPVPPAPAPKREVLFGLDGQEHVAWYVRVLPCMFLRGPPSHRPLPHLAPSRLAGTHATGANQTPPTGTGPRGRFNSG
jgi:hypothetical protein